MIRITTERLIPQEVIDSLQIGIYGAVVTFVGTVRLYNEGKRVRYLEYEAYPEMAEKKLEEIAGELRQKWDVEDVSIFHRLGRLKVGEASLVVAVATPHRRPGFEACLHAVERIKQVVPIWKKEVWEGGEAWVSGEHA